MWAAIFTLAPGITVISIEPVHSSLSEVIFCQLSSEKWHLRILVVCIILIMNELEHLFVIYIYIFSVIVALFLPNS